MTDAPQTPIRAQNLPIVVHAQYVKDVSFENPGAPQSLRPGQGNPNMDVAINLEARTIADDTIKALYELTIQLRVKASRENTPMFLASVDYAMVVSMPDIAEQHHHPVLLVEVPKLGFPFARQVLATLVQDGGFPPLLLTPVDFGAMYLEQFGTKNAAPEIPPASAAVN
jgi:preprotein translocase subunit SecB